MARRKASAEDQPIQADKPEWERCITVSVLERRKFNPGVLKKCVECKSAKEKGDPTARCQAHDGKTKHQVKHVETAEAFALFRLYRDAPEGRESINNVAEDNGKSASELRYMETLSSWFNWPDRRAAKRLHDDEEEERKHKRAKRTRRARVKLKVEQIQDDLLDRSVKLIDEADKMLAYPFVETTIEKGGKITIFKPAGWNRRDAARFYEKAADLAEFAGELDGPERILDGRALGVGTTVAPTGAVTSTAATESRSGIAEKVQTPDDLIKKVLIKIPSYVLYEAYRQRLEYEGRAEEEAQASEDSEREQRQAVLNARAEAEAVAGEVG